MPSTTPFQSPVAMSDSTFGTRRLHTSADPSSVPMVNSENDAGPEVSHSASAAAIFIGCCSVMSLACRSPEATTPTLATSTVTSAIFIDGRNTSAAFPRFSCQALIATTKMPAVTKHAVMVCANAPIAVELVSTAPKSFSSARPVVSLIV